MVFGYVYRQIYTGSRGDWGPLGHFSYFVKYLEFEKQDACVTYHNLLAIHSATYNKQPNYTCAAESLADDHFMGIGKVSQCAPCEGYIGTAAGDHWDTCINSLK